MMGSWLNKLVKLQRDEQGGVLVLVCFGLAALLGFSALIIDYGAVAVERRQLVTAADAAALAGAQELIVNPDFPAQAVARAVAYAEQNGVEAHRVTAGVSPGGNEIIVQVENGVAYHFARVFGETGRNVTARAKAIIGPVGGLIGVAPFSIVEQTLIYGVEYSLKYADWTESGLESGNYGALALGGSGANVYRNNIKNGFLANISTGDLLDTEQGNMSGPTAQGIGDLIAANCGCTLENYQPGCPLLVYIPIIRSITKDKVEVMGFAAFFIDKDKPPQPGNENVVTGAFVETMGLGQVNQNLPSYGVYAVNLVE